MISIFNEQELKDNYRRFKKYLDDYIEGERKDQLKNLFEKYEPRILNTPASSKIERHNAFPGGFVDHINNVIELCLSNHETFVDMLGEDQIDYTKDNLVFSALTHDLAKLGSITKPHYKKEWKISRIKYGNIYVYNKELQYSKYHDRTFKILADAGIHINDCEYYAIRMSDGKFDDDTKAYWNFYDESSLLPVILHTSDLQATKLETRKYKDTLEAKLDMFLRDRTGGNVSLFDEGRNESDGPTDNDEQLAEAVGNFFKNIGEEE